MTDDKKTAIGERIYTCEFVGVECPYCGYEFELESRCIESDSLWYGKPFDQHCHWCDEKFTVKVEDQARVKRRQP